MTQTETIQALLRLLGESDVHIKVNQEFPPCDILHEHSRLLKHGIEVTSYRSFEEFNGPYDLVSVMSFGTQCSFADVYVVAIIASLLGVEYAVAISGANQNIFVGGFIENSALGNWEAKPITLKQLLEINPRVSLGTAVKTYFPPFTEEDLKKRAEREESLNDPGDDYFIDDLENERNAFDFLTGGSRGTYEDWRK